LCARRAISRSGRDQAAWSCSLSKGTKPERKDYVNFVRSNINKTTADESKYRDVTGYLLSVEISDSYDARGKRDNLAKAGNHALLYAAHLSKVQDRHKDVIKRYTDLETAKASRS